MTENTPAVDEAPVEETPKKVKGKKAPAPPKRGKPDNIIAARAEVVSVDVLKPYPKNPRVGDVKAIAESLDKNGQFRPIVVNKRNMEILGGNHTWKAAKSLGWSKVSVVFVDVNDDAAARIVLADNRTNDLASYQTDVLADILKGLDSPVGTGYDEEAAKALTSIIDNSDVSQDIEGIIRPKVIATDEMVAEASNFQPPEEDNRFTPPKVIDDSQTGEVKSSRVIVNDDGEFEKASDVLTGAYGLKIDVLYDGVGEWGIPPLIPSMLVQPDDVPKNLKAWAGSATKDWPDPDQWWLYNYGIDSTSGMRDVSKSIMSFYCWDDYFINWWDQPDKMTGKMLNSGITMALTPDFSTWEDEPLVLSLLAIYRSRWLGRYFQEAGVKVIPHLTWPTWNYRFFDTVVRATLPDVVPVTSIQLTTFDKNFTEQQFKDAAAFQRHVYDSVKPELCIFYVGKSGEKFLKDYPESWPGEKLIVRNRLDALSAQSKQRGSKNTI